MADEANNLNPNLIQFLIVLNAICIKPENQIMKFFILKNNEFKKKKKNQIFLKEIHFINLFKIEYVKIKMQKINILLFQKNSFVIIFIIKRQILTIIFDKKLLPIH